MSIYSEEKFFPNVYILKSRVLGYMGEKNSTHPELSDFRVPVNMERSCLRIASREKIEIF